jgi:hypothetical protein
MTVDVLDRDERFVNGLRLEATVAEPSRHVRHVPLEQIAPGRYRGEFPVPRSGRYYITFTGRGSRMQVGPKTFGLAVPYSSEYLDLGADRVLLRDIAAITGGRLLPLSRSSVGAVTAPSPRAPGPLTRFWWPLLLAALALLVLEVAVRKAVLPERWHARWARLRDAADSVGTSIRS